MSIGGTNENHSSNNHPNADRSANSRWSGIMRPYLYSDVLRLRGSIRLEYTLAHIGAQRLWRVIHADPYVAALGALTGNQAHRTE